MVFVFFYFPRTLERERPYSSVWIHSWNNHASGGFTYLEHRVTNNCPAAYHYGDSYQMWSLARMFNPSHAAQHLAPDGVDALADIKPLSHHNEPDRGHEVGGARLPHRVHGRRGRHDEHGGIHQLHLALLAPQTARSSPRGRWQRASCSP